MGLSELFETFETQEIEKVAEVEETEEAAGELVAAGRFMARGFADELEKIAKAHPSSHKDDNERPSIGEDIAASAIGQIPFGTTIQTATRPASHGKFQEWIARQGGHLAGALPGSALVAAGLASQRLHTRYIRPKSGKNVLNFGRHVGGRGPNKALLAAGIPLAILGSMAGEGIAHHYSKAKSNK